MTQLLAHRDTLAAARCECGHPVSEWHHPTRGCTYLGVGVRGCPCERDWADALLASGAVRDAASLPDDEALVEATSNETRSNHLMCDETTVADVLRALAAALAPTEEKA